ncbi:MAG: hypothetical protein ACTHWZ_03365 [Peptoniphilaceae bacterium]
MTSLEEIKSLLKIQLLNMNPLYTDQLRERNKENYKENPSKIYKDILYKNFGLGTIMLFLIYGGLALAVDFKTMPFTIDSMIIFTFMLAFANEFTVIYNVFYESKDIEAYMPLPIRPLSLYTAKLIVVSMGSFSLLSPMIVYFIFYFWDFSWGFSSLILGLIWFLNLFLLNQIFGISVMNVITRTSLIKKFRTGVLIAITTAVQVVGIGFYYFLQREILQSRGKSGFLNKTSPFTNIMNWGNPWILGIISLIVLGGIFYILVKKDKDKYYSTVLNTKEEKTKVERENKNRNISLNRFLFKYNLGLISNSTVINSCVVAPTITPMFILMSFIINSQELFSRDINYSMDLSILISILIGVVMAIIIGVYPSSLPRVFVSIEGENLDYVMSTPLNLKKHWRSKLMISVGIMGAVSLISIIVVYLVLPINKLLILISLIFFFSLLYSKYKNDLYYDFKNRVVNYQTVSEIFQRTDKMIMGIKIIGAFILAVILPFLSIHIGGKIGYNKVSILFVITWIILNFILNNRVKEFWEK